MDTDMFLEQLKLTDFKNYREAELKFSEKINCFIGNNGAGKTNLLDAIYYLSFCKSYFNLLDQQNIRHGSEFFAVHGTYRFNGDPNIVSCIQRRNQKKVFRFNKKEYDRLADHIGKIPLVMISPYDRDLINEGSEFRRKFMDGMISQFDPLYLDHLLHYNKVLQYRNSLIRQCIEAGHTDQALFSLYDEQLAVSGQFLYERRKEFQQSFIPIFRQYYALVSNSAEEVNVLYDSTLHQIPIAESLKKNFAYDLQMRYTTFGIHKDDLDFRIGNYPLKKFGSQGQQKSFIIAIKLAQFDYTKDRMGFKPVLLFDDIFDKLDDQRVNSIVNLVGRDSFGQVFITDTQEQRIRKLFAKSDIDHRIFAVNQGVVEQIQNHLP